MAKSIKEQGILPELKSFSLFEELEVSDIENLCSGSRTVFTSHREKLTQFGDEAHFFYFVLNGAYKLSRPSPMGEDTIVHFSLPGDVIGAFIMAQPNPRYPVSATSMGPSRALMIPRQNYIESWKERPQIILKIQNMLSTRMTMLHNQMSLSKANLNVKIATILIHLMERQESSLSSDATLSIPLTRKEIADSVGSTVESVIRVMSEWAKNGLIKTQDQQITILRPDKIIEILSLPK